MAQVKRFEEFRADKKSESVNEFFKSKEKKAELTATKKAFEDKLKEFKDKGFEVDAEFLTKKAEENKYRGELKAVKSKKSGKVMVIYKEGLTKLQKIASGSGSSTRNENVEIEEEIDEIDEIDEMDESIDEMEEFDCSDYEDEDEEDEEDVEDIMEEVEEFEDEEEVENLTEGVDAVKAVADLEAKMDEYEAKKFIVKRDVLLQKAKENKYRGELKAVKSRRSGKVMVIYKDGLTKLQRLATGANKSISNA